jgi:hypothetical protein
MPSLTRKLIHGLPYYYLRYCQRVAVVYKIIVEEGLERGDSIGVSWRGVCMS